MITFDKAIDIAIREERASQKLYKNAGDKTTSESIKKLLDMLYEQEKEHEEKLKELKKDKDIELDLKKEIHLSEQSMLTELSELNNLKKILEFALEKENKASDMYKKLSECSIGKIHDLFKRLEEEENSHYVMIEKELKVIEYI